MKKNPVAQREVKKTPFGASRSPAVPPTKTIGSLLGLVPLASARLSLVRLRWAQLGSVGRGSVRWAWLDSSRARMGRCRPSQPETRSGDLTRFLTSLRAFLFNLLPGIGNLYFSREVSQK